MGWFVAASWGVLSAQFIIQAAFFAVNFFVCLFGFLKGGVSRKDNLVGMAVAAFGAVLYSSLFSVGYWLCTYIIQIGQSDGENIVFWIFAILSTLYLLPQIPPKFKANWRMSFIPGEAERICFKAFCERAINSK